MTYSVPPDSRHEHDSGHLSDHSNISDALSDLLSRVSTQEATQIVYVSTSGDDSKNGRTWGAAKATIAGALAALAGPGVIQLGYGTWTISAADVYGNAVTLPAITTLRGLGRNLTVLRINTTVTWGIQAIGAMCVVENLDVTLGASGVVTHGVGVDTPTSAGSAENCLFTNVAVTKGSGTLTNCFALGPTWAGSGNVDIAETYFTRCYAYGGTGAGYFLGNGTSANILNTYIRDSMACGNQYGVYAQSTNFAWESGTLQKNSYDIYLYSSAGIEAPILAKNLRSENSGQLFYSQPGTGGQATVTLENISWQGGNGTGGLPAPPSTGIIISHGYAGTLNLNNVTIKVSTLVPHNPTPLIQILGPSIAAAQTVNVAGLLMATPITQAFSCGSASPVVVNVQGYTQLNPTNNYEDANVWPSKGLVTLLPSTTQVSINGTSRYVMLPSASKSQPSPTDMGALAWTGYPPTAITTVKPTGMAGIFLYWSIWVPQPCTVNNILYALDVAGVSMSNAYLGLYSGSGATVTKLAECTTDQSTNMTGSANAYTAALSTPYTIPSAGRYGIGLVIGAAATMPTLMAIGSAVSPTFTNLGMGAASLAAAYGGGGLTALPSSMGVGAANIGLPLFALT